MSRTQTHVIFGRQNHLPTPDELQFRSGPATIMSDATSPPNVDITSGIIETSNSSGKLLIDHVITNPTDGKILSHDQLYTKRVRNRWTGEIIATYHRVYQWTRRSITYLERKVLVVNGVTYPLDPRVGELNGRPSDTSDAKGPVNRSTTVHFPFDVEVYDPDNPGDLLGPDIDYTVTFLNWDGTVINTQTVKPGGTAVPPASPVKPGNTFIGWSEDFINVQRDMIIKPIYSNDDLQVTWVDWDSSMLKTEIVKFGGAATPPSDPSRVGHEFYGWDADYTFITGVTTITAQYLPHQFSVTFLDWDDTVLAVKTANYGQAPQKMIDPSRPHYNFTGWDKDITSITADTVTKATYEIQKFTVTYRDTLANTNAKLDVVEYGKDSVPPVWPWSTDPVYDGYEFYGWDGVITNITDHITVQSLISRKRIKITVIDQFTGGIIRESKVAYGSNFVPFNPPDHIDEGQEFNGWSAAPGDELISMIKDTTVIAQYTLRWLTIMFLTETGAYSDPPVARRTDRIRYGWTLTEENLMLPYMNNDSGTMYVENWVYLDQASGRMKVMTADTKLFDDLLVYPRFQVPPPPPPKP